MGGTIQVSSQVDKGSLFIVELDLRIPDGKSDEQFWQENKIHRILVVDDEADMGRNIQMLMEDAGVQAELAFCGEDALCRIRSAQEMGEHYDVILLDWKMPDMDGIETARCIRKIVPDGTLILLLSAHDWDEIEEDAVGAGIQGFLTKPFFVSAFKEKIFEINTAHDQEIQASENAKEHSLNGVHFLVAEDNEINSEILEELLEVEGAVCHIAENGHLAVEAFKNAPPGTFDAILMDVQMPVMNGYEATLAIRSLEREDAETIPIIAMTANAFAEDVRDAKDAGMNDHIAKPIDMDIVRKTLYKYLKEK